jgi:hypothetical protein
VDEYPAGSDVYRNDRFLPLFLCLQKEAHQCLNKIPPPGDILPMTGIYF